MRFLKEPFVQFLVLGGLIFLAYSFSDSAKEKNPERLISIDGPKQQSIFDNFNKQFRRPPTRVKMDALLRAHIKEEVKYREALVMGLDQEDSIVRRRMEQKFNFLFGDAAADRIPDESELQAWYDAHSADFVIPATISLTHVWFSPDRRGTGVENDATAALKALRSGEQFSGDPFPSGSAFESLTEAKIRSIFGAQFASSVFTLPIDEWSGPLRSGLGYHLVRVSARTEGVLRPLEEVRDFAIEGWRESESERILEELVDKLEADYQIDIDEKALDQLDYSEGPTEFLE